MFRKMTFAIATVAVLGAAALAPTSASAHGFGGFGGHGFGHGRGFGWGGIGLGLAGGYAADQCGLVRQVYATPYGPVVRWVNVCY